MKSPFLILLALIVFESNIFAQNKIDENFQIYLNDNKSSKNSKLPILLEEEEKKTETLFILNGEKAVKEVKYFKEINSDFTFKLINPALTKKRLLVDLKQEKNKLILILKDSTLNKNFASYKNGRNQRLVFDMANGIIITKTGRKASAITIPIKIYLFSNSDSLENFTNNIETNANIAFTFGYSLERYSFKKDRAPKLTSTYNFFGFLGLNKLTLNKKNTDGINDGDNILSFSFGMGHQFGYGKFGISLLLGIDLPTSSIRKNWVFRHQPWLGFGIGYSIFK